MNYSKYGKAAFEANAASVSAARGLADDLQRQVLVDLNDVVSARLKEIVAALNSEGHNLTEYDVSPGDFGYRDQNEAGECHLRLGCDVVISVGYRDCVDSRSSMSTAGEVTSASGRSTPTA